VVLFGDSHALQWFPAFEKLANRHGWRLLSLTRSSCSPAAVPVINSKLKRVYRECDGWRDSALARIREVKPRLVVVSSSTGYRSALAGHPADPDGLWAAAWARLFAELGAGTGNVALLGDTPFLSRDPADCATRVGARSCAPRQNGPALGSSTRCRGCAGRAARPWSATCSSTATPTT